MQVAAMLVLVHTNIRNIGAGQATSAVAAQYLNVTRVQQSVAAVAPFM